METRKRIVKTGYLLLAAAFAYAGILVAVNQQTLVSQLIGRSAPIKLSASAAMLAGLFWVLLALHCGLRVLLPPAASGPRFWLPFGLLVMAGLSFVGAHILQFYYNVTP